jgi:MinD-like ATPase involved in chromosome partitioning or flagellar assembly
LLIKRRSWKDNNLNKSSRFLRSFRKKVLLIDADPQAASSGLGIDVDNVEIGTYQILEHSNTPAEAIIKCSAPNVDIIPSHIDLVAIEIELVENREYMLKKALESIKMSMTLSSSIVHQLGLTKCANCSRFSHHSYSV